MTGAGRRDHLSVAARRLTLVPPPADAIRIADQTVVVGLSGNLTGPSNGAVRTHLLRLVQAGGPHDLVLDLSRVTSVDAAGLTPLLEAHRLQVGRGGGLHIGDISRPVAVHLYADQAVADVLMPQLGFDHPAHWAAEARWFETGVGCDPDSAC